ncbi:MAG: nucleotidyltransferase domain-containing protein [Armatimonadetes bacterium]|nr:nucleotidyltransferase domain-containing protein [Armatimonadota bacterium]
MTTMRDIAALSEAIVREFAPERVLLFGSHAYGVPTADSDVDLLVVMPHDGKPSAMATQIRRRVRPKFALDLLVRSPEALAERIEMNDCFVREIVARGRVLYERHHA